MNQKKEHRFTYGTQEIVLETGRLAKQADGTAFITCGGTQVLTTVCSAAEIKDGQDFFPLLVDYKAPLYAGGKFLGGFLKREGRPSNKEILLMRMIDRPLRPLFPEGYMAETIIQAKVLSYDENVDPQVIAGLSATAALALSDVPFSGSVGFCKVGRIDGKFVLNPALADWENSDLEMVIAGTGDAILMVEGEINELPEADVLEAILFGHAEIKKFCAFLDGVVAECGKPKREFISAAPNKTLMEKVEAGVTAEARACLEIVPKLERRDAIAALNKKVAESIKAAPEIYGLSAEDDLKKEAYKAVDELMYRMMRNDILKEDRRIGGRKLDEVRPIETEVDLLKTAHGSSLFTRGETQVLAVTTLGDSKGDQMSDALEGITYDKFYLHYTFPPFSVGEARGYRGVGRREIGHGNLAERALKKMLPSQEDFPYTIRLACEVLESNGSSSMGSVCSGSMALMDAGVPLKKPVAGVAMGLIKQDSDFKILTDILGDEDHLGDMDFKVAGTADGITAIQMDIKIGGISAEIFQQAMTQAHAGRLHILKEMEKTIAKGRDSFKPGVPSIERVQIDKDKIGALIGPGGKNIKSLQERFEVNIEVSEDGEVRVLGADDDKRAQCLYEINLVINGPKVGEQYDATVVTIKEYGAFVDIIPGVAGLVHISELADDRVEFVEEYLKEGDDVKVKVVDIDSMGRVKLSIKAVASLEKKYDKPEKRPERERSERNRDDRPRRR